MIWITFKWLVAFIVVSVVSSLLVTGSHGQESTTDKRIRTRRVFHGKERRFPASVHVAAARLAHTTQLLPADCSLNASSQCVSVLEQLDRTLNLFNSERSNVVQLNGYVRNSEVRTLLLEQLIQWSPDGLPAVTCVATRLPESEALVAIDAIFASTKAEPADAPARHTVKDLSGADRVAHVSLLPPGDTVYVSGQAETGNLAEATYATLESLHRTLQHLKLDKRNIVQVKCFLAPMRDASIVNREIAKFFSDTKIPPVSHVEWISGSRPIEIELVAWAPKKFATDTVSFATPPWMKSSPVFSRVARIHGNDRIFVSGIYAEQAGSGEEQVKDIFYNLEHILEKSNSNLEHLAKATYYVTAPEASAALNQLRPEYYDPEVPPAASKAMVEDVAYPSRTIMLDMIAAPAP
ncbi:MAG: RidA family protein [Planctomycetes bacterium]|nr:RidA family protein [Planctomycetota bacterium]